MPGSNAEAMNITLTALQEMGRIEDVDAARVQALKSMADGVGLEAVQFADVAGVPRGVGGGVGR